MLLYALKATRLWKFLTYEIFAIRQSALDVLGLHADTPEAKKNNRPIEWLIVAMVLGFLLSVFVVGSTSKWRQPAADHPNGRRLTSAPVRPTQGSLSSQQSSYRNVVFVDKIDS